MGRCQLLLYSSVFGEGRRKLRDLKWPISGVPAHSGFSLVEDQMLPGPRLSLAESIGATATLGEQKGGGGFDEFTVCSVRCVQPCSFSGFSHDSHSLAVRRCLGYSAEEP